MSHAAIAKAVTVAEFDAFTDAQPEDTRWELVDGQILAMTNPTAGHGQIVANLGMAMKAAADRQGCRTIFGGLRVQAVEAGTGVDKTIPDILVTCGAWSPRRTFITDPTVIVEVLSPSTMDYDRGAKLAFYKSLPSLQDIILVYQDEVRVEHERRDGDTWKMTPLTRFEHTLGLVGLPLQVILGDVYAETGLEAA